MATAICRGTDESPHKKAVVELKHGVGTCPKCGMSFIVRVAGRGKPKPKTDEVKSEEIDGDIGFNPYPDRNWVGG